MIIWLASYPKRGNTLLRSMLSAYLFSGDGIFNFELLKNIKQFPIKQLYEKLKINTSDPNETIKYSIKAQELFNKKDTVGFVKTHSSLFNYNKKYPFTNLENSLGAVYIVRDPRNIVLSYARHMSVSVEKATKFITRGKGNGIDIMGNWSDNYLSWKSLKINNKYLLVKYEDLILNRDEVFLKILEFIFNLRNINFSVDQNKLNNMLRTTTFSYLKDLEKEKTFGESMIDKKTNERIPFFHKGPQRDWSNSLELNLSNEIEKFFNKEMTELGYL